MLKNIKRKEYCSLELTWRVTVETKYSIFKRKSESQFFIPMRIPCEDLYSFQQLYSIFEPLRGFSYNDISETIDKVFGNDHEFLNNSLMTKNAYLYHVADEPTFISVFSEKKNDERKKLWILTFSLDCEEPILFNKYLYSSVEDVSDIERDFDTIIEVFNGDGAAFRNALKKSKYMKYCSPHIDIFGEKDVLDTTLLRYECRDLYPVYTEDSEEE